jgi:hypothetical protein
MKRNRKTVTASPEIITSIAEMAKTNLELLTRLGERLEASERAHIRFEFAVVGKLSRIEAMAQLLGLSNTIVSCRKYGGSVTDKAEKLEELIDEQSREIESRLMKYLQKESIPSRDRRRK